MARPKPTVKPERFLIDVEPKVLEAFKKIAESMVDEKGRPYTKKTYAEYLIYNLVQSRDKRTLKLF